MRTKKKMITFLLSAAMVAMMGSATVFAEEVTTIGSATAQGAEVQLETQDSGTVQSKYAVTFADGTLKMTAVYTGKAITPAAPIAVKIKNADGTQTDVPAGSYSISYDNGSTTGPVSIGVHYITIKGLGDYSDLSATLELDITAKDIAKCTIGVATTGYKYTGKSLKPVPVVKDGATTLVLNKDFTISYGKNINVGNGTLTITGKGTYAGSKSATFKIVKNSINNFKVAISKKSYVYTGKAQKPLVTISNGTVKLASSNYKVSYKNNKKIGTASVTVTAKGSNIYGKKTFTYKILPATPKLKKVSNKSNGVYLSWSKSKNSRYYVYRSTNGGKTFKKIAWTKYTHYTDKKAVGAKKYTYCIVAYKGNYRSAVSVKKTILTKLATPKIKSIKNTGSALKVKWGKVSGAAYYQLYRKASGEDYVLLYKGTKTTFTDKVAIEGTKYTYKVMAVATLGKSLSKGVTAKRSSKSSSSGSYSLKVIRDSEGYRTFNASWKKQSGAACYEIWWSKDSSFDSTHYSTTDNTYFEPQVKYCGKGTWYIKVRAIKVSGSKTKYSSWSKVSKFTIK